MLSLIPPIALRLLGALLTTLALSLAWACDRPAPDEPAPQQAASRPADAAEAADAPLLRVVHSDALPEAPQRIVSLAPNVTEILFALGLGPRVVAVTRFCDYPPEAVERPKIGGMLDPDFEAIAAARPDLVVGVISGADGRLPTALEKAGLAFAFVEIDTLAQTYAGIERLGQFVGEAEAARDLVARMQAEMEAQARRFQARRDALGPAPSILMVYDHAPLVAGGPGNFGHELLELAGARNVLRDFPNAYPVLDIEQILTLNPDRIIDASIGPTGAQVEAFWQRYPSLQAVRTGQVAHFQDGLLLRPGPRLPKALEAIGLAIYGADDRAGGAP